MNLKTNKEEKVKQKTKEETIEILEEHVSFLGLTTIEKNYWINHDQNYKIDLLAIDEDYRLVVLEYRFGKWSRTIQNGLIYIDYIQEHLSEFKLLIADHFGKEFSKKVHYVPRLIILTESFHFFDYQAIQKMPYLIEAIHFRFMGQYLIFEKHFQSKSIDHSIVPCIFSSEQDENLYHELSDAVLSLGEEVVETSYGSYLSYRKIRPFFAVSLEDGIKVYLRKKMIPIESSEDIEKILPELGEVYDTL